MKILENLNDKRLKKELLRPVFKSENLEKTVAGIFKKIKKEGNKAISELTDIYDKVRISEFLVTEKEIVEASSKITEDLKIALETAKKNIEKFHKAQDFEFVPIETTKGVLVWQKNVAIERVGLYIPGGTAPLCSTVLMLAVPAKISGCSEILICSPPDKNGEINPAILYSAKLSGVDKIYKIGGIQAIAAMTIGTETIKPVYKIFGPGNQYVTAAKQYAAKLGTAIDLPAGPSEVMIVADNSAVPQFVAADLLSQAEHGTDSQTILVCFDKKFALKVQEEITSQLEKLPRKEIASKCLENSKIIIVKQKEEALKIVNEYAPEHLILSTVENEFYVENLKNAGSVFIGNFTPESAGDYASGTNHTLPTNGYAKAFSGVTLDSFTKKISFQKISEKGIKNLGKTIEIIAETEQLQAHKNAVSVRLEYLNKL